jgi:hypothetical protein
MTTSLRPGLLQLVAALLVAGPHSLPVHAADRAAVTGEAGTHALDGVWALVGKPGNVGPAGPASPLKFRSGGRWTYTRADPVTGAVKSHFGGTCSSSGTEYVEVIDYSMDPKDPELGKTLKFRVKIEGDTMTQTGIGNAYAEVWKRLR